MNENMAGQRIGGEYLKDTTHGEQLAEKVFGET
jgi:hypothetical protein